MEKQQADVVVNGQNISRMLFALPAYLLVAAVCGVGVMSASVELGTQNVRFVLVVSALLVCAVATWIFNAIKVRPGAVDIVSVAFAAWWTVAFFASDGIAVSRLAEMGLLAGLYVSLRVLLSVHRGMARWLLVVLFVCGIVEAAIGMRQAFGAIRSNHDLFSVTGTFFNPGPYGGYLAVIVSMAAGYVAARWKFVEVAFRRRRWLWLAAFGIAAIALIGLAIMLPATMSRAAFVAVGIAAVAVGLRSRGVVYWVRTHKQRVRVIVVSAVVVVAAAGWGLYSLKKDSADGRMLMWKIEAKMIADNPVTGVGPGYFRGGYGETQAEYFSSGERSETEIHVAGAPEYGFNEYLQIGAETGVPGFVLFVALVAAALWRLFRRGSSFAFGLAALAVFAMFSYPLSLISMKMLFVVFLDVAGTQRGIRKPSRLIAGVVLAGCVVTTVWSVKTHLDRKEAFNEWREARRWYSMKKYSYVLEDYPALLTRMEANPTFLFEYGRALSLEGRHEESIEILTRATRLSNDPVFHTMTGNSHKALGRYDLAAEAYLRAHHSVPNRMYPLYLLGKMYSEIGDHERATHYARLVIGMTPKIPSPATDDMQAEMRDVLNSSTG